MGDIYTKQVLTDTVVPLRGTMPDNRAQNALEQMSGKKLMSARNTYAQTERNSAAKLMADAYGKFADDPQALENELNNIKARKIKEIADPAVLSSFITDFDLKSTSYVANAKRNFDTTQRKEQKSALNDALSDSINEIAENAFGMFESDDDDIKVGYMHAKQTATDAIAAKGDNGLNIFTDAERNRSTKQISKGALVGLQNFVNAPDVDPLRIKQVIKRFNEGAYDGMFNEEDKARAARLLKAAGKAADKAISGGSGTSSKDESTVAGEMYKITLDEYKKDSKDNAYSNASMIDLLDFRQSAFTDYQLQRISDKEFKDIMSKSAPALVRKIDEYVNKDLSMWHGDSDLQHGIKRIRNFADQQNLSPDQRLFLYEGFMREYRADTGAEQGKERFGDEPRAEAAKYADKITQRWVQDQFPGWDPKVAPAIVMGRTVYRTPTSASELYKNKDYQLMELD